MKSLNCEFLDDYQNGDLDAEDVAAFELHLNACEECRRSVELDRRIGGLLASVRPAAPQFLPARIDREVRGRRRSQVLRRAGLLATAAVVLAAVMWQWMGRRPPQAAPTPHVVVAAVAPRRPEVRITFPDEANVIVMPLESKNPQVSIVWVYPVLRPAE